jgi:hypothetical protein
VAQCISHGLRQVRPARHARHVVLQPKVQVLDQRPTSQLTNALTHIRRLAADPGLDLVEFGNACQYLGRERRVGGGVEFVERPPRVRPTECQLDRGILARLDQAAEPGIAIHLQCASECRQVRGRMLAPAILGVDVGCCRMRGAGPGAIIDRVAPQPPGLGLSPAGIEHRQCCLIGEHLVRRQHRAEHQFIERRQPPAGTSHPGAQRRTIQCDALALEHLCLAVERQRVTELADHNVRHHRFRRHAAIDRPVRRGGLHHGALAGAASIAWPAHHLHAQLGRHQVELLSAVFTDHVQRATAARALPAVDINDDLVARQVCWQCAPIAVGNLCAPPSLRRLRRIAGGLAFGGVLLRVLQDKLQLIEIELLRSGAVAVAQQTLDQLPQLFVLGLQFRHHFLQHLLQDSRIVRQGREIDLHNMMIMAHVVASPPMTPA